jgi:hypothetical protein
MANMSDEHGDKPLICETDLVKSRLNKSIFLIQLNAALCSKNNPRNINYMPACPVGPADRTGVVIFFACLDLEQKS